MSAHAYTEDQLVEQPAIGLFAELGWAVAVPPPTTGVAGESRDAGLRVQSLLPPEAITAAVPGVLCEWLADFQQVLI